MASLLFVRCIAVAFALPLINVQGKYLGGKKEKGRGDLENKENVSLLFFTLNLCRYAFEALVSIEFHGTKKGSFRFTGFHYPGVPSSQVPHLDVTGG
jgi:hypothetical protein